MTTAPPPLKTNYIGIASFSAALLAFVVLVVGTAITARFWMAYRPDLGGQQMVSGLLFSAAMDPFYMRVIFAVIVLCLTALILGIVGLFGKDRHRFFPRAGIMIAFGVVAWPIVLAVVGTFLIAPRP